MKIYEVADFSILPELPNIKLLKKHTGELLNLY